MPDLSLGDRRLTLAINLELSHGRHGASARVEVLERDGRRVARLGLRGWIEGVAMSRLEEALVDLAAREDVEGVILDGSHLRHVEFRVLPKLSGALARFESRPLGVTLSGLPPHLSDLFRLVGLRTQKPWDPAMLPEPKTERERTT